MSTIRKIRKVLKSKHTLEGAGVHLKRAFGNSEVPLFDPFLLFDDFRSNTPEHYLKGFPWHPHRGIETVTYVLAGDVEHGDSLGNKGVIHGGDVQWMTAGSGIIHQEMPKGEKNGKMYGFQLWANLPARDKMMNPRYRDITSDQIPTIQRADGTLIRIICGEIDGVKGPVEDIVIDPEYIDVTLPPGVEFRHTVKKGHTVFAYIIGGQGYFCKEKNPFAYDVREAAYFDIERNPFVIDGTIVLFGDGDEIVGFTEEKDMRFLLISGNPIKEPVAWHGPVVMNKPEELQVAFEEYEKGTFIKYKG